MADALFSAAKTDLGALADGVVYNAAFLWLYREGGLEKLLMQPGDSAQIRLIKMAGLWSAAGVLKQILESHGYSLQFFTKL